MKGILDIKISKKYLLYVMLLLPYFIPTYFYKFNYASEFILLWKISGLAYVFVNLIQGHIINKVSLILLALSSYFLFISILNRKFEVEHFKNIILILLLDSMITKNNVKCFFSSFVNIGFLAIIINLCTMIIFPNGMYDNGYYQLNWFLGYKNVMIRYILPIVAISLMQYICFPTFKYKIRNIILMLVVFITTILSQSVNSVVGYLLFVVIVLLSFGLYSNKFKKRKYKIRITKILCLIFVTYIVLDLLLLKTTIFSNVFDFFMNYMDKEDSLNGRLNIWNQAFIQIENNMWFGTGYVDKSMFNLSFVVSHPHNLLLYNLMLGGVVGVLLWGGVFLVSDYYLSRIQSRLYKCIIISFYIVGFVMGLNESLIGFTFFYAPLLTLPIILHYGLEVYNE